MVDATQLRAIYLRAIYAAATPRPWTTLFPRVTNFAEQDANIDLMIALVNAGEEILDEIVSLTERLNAHGVMVVKAAERVGIDPGCVAGIADAMADEIIRLRGLATALANRDIVVESDRAGWWAMGGEGGEVGPCITCLAAAEAAFVELKKENP